jgi:ribosomal protein S18 acetylase RimI-like enzyme
MPIRLQRCTIADLDQLREVSVKTFRDAFEKQNNPEDFQLYLQKAFNTDQLKGELLNPETIFYWAFAGNERVGYCKINEGSAQSELQDPDALELERIYVFKGYQGKGYGRSALNQILQLGREKAKNYLWLGVWEHNHRAIRFYKEYGFTTFDKHPYYIGSDRQMDWMMKIELNRASNNTEH